MYTPKHFEETRIEVMHQLMADNPLATLVTASADGLRAEHIPLIVTANGNLIGHVARANPLLQTAGNVLAIFQGPQAYVSPSWYATKAETGKVVPTWNYAVVHAHGMLVLHDEPEWILAQMDALTRAMESGMAEPWLVSDAPRDFTEKLVGAVVGIEIVVTKLEGKWKVSQNQPEANRRGVVAGLELRGAIDMAELVKRIGE